MDKGRDRQKEKKNRLLRKQRSRQYRAGEDSVSEGMALVSLGRQLGNRAVQRVVQSGRLEGEAALASFSPAQLRQAVLARAAPTVQRDEAEALDAAPAAESTGEVTIEAVQSDDYEVSGTTLAEVGPQLDPQEWGRCRYQVDYSVETTAGRVTKVDITLRLTIRMPVWREGYDRATPAARREWQRMIRALQGHEDRHAEIARAWAPRFKERILGVRAIRAQSTYNTTKGKLDKEQRDYDQATTHGQTEGVSLDLSIP